MKYILFLIRSTVSKIYKLVNINIYIFLNKSFQLSNLICLNTVLGIPIIEVT